MRTASEGEACETKSELPKCTETENSLSDEVAGGPRDTGRTTGRRSTFLSHSEHTLAADSSPEVRGFNDEVVVVTLQVAVLTAENVQHLHHH